MKTATLLKSLLAALALMVAHAAQASEPIVLRVHHFLPPGSLAQSKMIEPWCAKISQESQGRLKCQIYPSMQLGGTPNQLFDQVKDGVADVIWTLPGYQPDRFPMTEVFELPFMTTSGEKASRALWEFVSKYARSEYKGVKPLAFHMHDGAQLHMAKKLIKTLDDFKGLKLRAPTRQSAKLIEALGATAVPLPMPQVPEAIARGIIDGAPLPWEVVPTLKIEEVARFHSETPIGVPSLANYVYLLAMNPAKYESLPEDLKKVINANSGADTSAWAGKVWDDSRASFRQVAIDQKNTFYEIPVEEIRKWEAATSSVSAEWVKTMNAKGYDGNRILSDAKRLLE